MQKIQLQFVLNLIDKSIRQPKPNDTFTLLFVAYNAKKNEARLRSGTFKKARVSQAQFIRNQKKNLIALYEVGSKSPITVKIYFLLKFNGYPIDHTYLKIKQ